MQEPCQFCQEKNFTGMEIFLGVGMILDAKDSHLQESCQLLGLWTTCG